MAALALSLSFSSQLLSHQSITIINTATPLPLPPPTTTKPKFKKQKKQPKVKTHEGKIRDPHRGFLPQRCGSRIWPLWVFVAVGLWWDNHLSVWVFCFHVSRRVYFPAIVAVDRRCSANLLWWPKWWNQWQPPSHSPNPPRRSIPPPPPSHHTDQSHLSHWNS